MRGAYTLLGVAWLIVFVAAWWALNHTFTKKADTASNTSTSTISSSTATMTQSIFTLTSSAFGEGASIPSRFTCDGEQINPPLSITGAPAGAKSLALIVEDPDIPDVVKQSRGIQAFDHWVLFNIPPETRAIGEGQFVGTLGNNGAGKAAYTGPCPPPQYEPSQHRYFFRLYALDIELSLQAGASRAEVEQAMEGHIIAQSELQAVYKRK